MTPPRPLRILHLTAGSDAGGISRYLYDLCRAMHDAGHHVAIAGQRGPWHHLFQSAPWPWIDAPLKAGPLGLWRAAGILTDYLARNPADVLHAHYRKATLVARRLQRQTAIPLLYTLHLSHIPVSGLRRWFTDFGDYAHVASSEARQWLIEQGHVPAGRITLIPHGVDPEKFPVGDAASRQAARLELGLAADDRVALFVGRLENPKNEACLLDVAAMSRQSLPALRILLAGEGPNEPALRRQIQRDGLADRVRLLGHRQPLPLYHAADALLLPSAREGFSLACAEAMCAGLPVLRTRTSGTAELIIEAVTGKSVPIDRQAFVRAAVDFLSDPSALARMGAAAAQHVRRNFTFDRQLQQTIDLYRSIAASGQPPAE